MPNFELNKQIIIYNMIFKLQQILLHLKKYFDMCKKDIKCIKCGWEWNKKDSELWDMYVCHKCGFDNITFYIPAINNYNRGGRI